MRTQRGRIGKKATIVDRGYWGITVTYADEHVAKGTCTGLQLLSKALEQFLGSEHGNIVSIHIVDTDG